MSQTIKINILNKIATCLTEIPIVCGNSDYVAEFVFDDEWNGHSVKTARFRVNGEYTDVIFEGNECPMPIISNAKIVWVGVFAGELSTSTPAIVHCKASILDGEDVPAPPREDVYSQIIALYEEALDRIEELEKGGGGSGENGATFIPSVSEEGLLSWTNDKGLQNPNPVNVKGGDGTPGVDGHTPIKGVDYYTEADKSEMVQAVLSALPDNREVAY